MPASASPTSVLFANFQLDLRTGELRRDGAPVRLQPQPAKVLTILVGRAGEVVTRQELALQVWGSETFVDYEQGLNFAIRQIRTVLDDDAENPKFVETLPRRGYRFNGPVTELLPVDDVNSQASTDPSDLAPTIPLRSESFVWRYGVGLLVVAVAGMGLFFTARSHPLRRDSPAGNFSSVAVLPLRNLSRDPEQEYFSDGVTDELITELAKIGRLRVISHTSVQRYKESRLSLREIAKELGVNAVIEGTVMRSGGRVRITAQLIDARTDQHLWAESYERDFQNILGLQSDVAQEIATQVGVNLTVAEKASLENSPAVDPAAHEAYLRGRFFWNKFNCAGFKKGLEYFQQAVRIDPKFAPAHVGIADSYFNLSDWGCIAQDVGFAQSRAAALRALQLDPELASAHAQQADFAFYVDWNWPVAEQEYRKAIERDSNDAGIHAAYAVFLVAMGRPEQAQAEMKQAYTVDPVAEETNMIGTYVLYLSRQYDRAIEQGSKTLEMYPNSMATYHWLAQSYEQKGMKEQALSAYLKANPGHETGPGNVSQREDLPAYFQKELKNDRHRPDPVCWQTLLYAHLGEKERALELLEQSFRQHCDGMQFLKVNPVYDGIREDARFKALVVRLGL